MIRNRIAFAAFLFAGFIGSIQSSFAESRCDCCGGCGGCQKVCRMVCEMKEVTKTTWCCATEDICVPGKSLRCQSACNCGHCPDCRDTGWTPTVAYIKTRKVPVKRVETIQKPTYRFVVETLCEHCADAKSGH